MHPDRKIGLAMGILLIGIVGALFFRNEPLTTSNVPSIRREQQLNEHLRSRDVAVYLEDRPDSAGSEDEQQNRRWTLRELLHDLNDRNDGVPLPITVSPAPARTTGGELPPLMPRSAPSDDQRSTASGTAPTAGPMQQNPVADVTPVVPATQNAGPSESVTAGAVAPDSPEELPDPADFEEYVVRYGDTLSQIAERFLGSPARFQEIFEINRDRLAAPDRLKVGKAIRIPRN